MPEKRSKKPGPVEPSDTPPERADPAQAERVTNLARLASLVFELRAAHRSTTWIALGWTLAILLSAIFWIALYLLLR